MVDTQWAQKHRPKNIDDCALPARLKSAFSEYRDTNIPNMILVGSAGVGKTTIASALLDESKFDVIVINASMDRGIDTIRNDIQTFATSMSILGGDRKFVLLDEADYLAPTAQPALRNLMESVSANCGFILTCNYPEKIIAPLRSRCSVVDFTLTRDELLEAKDQFRARAKMILRQENKSCDDETLDLFIDQYAPDWRKVLNELQMAARGDKIAVESLTEAVVEQPDTPPNIKSGTIPFWQLEGKRVSISAYKLIQFLTHYNFGLFTADRSRTGMKTPFYNDDGVMKVVDEFGVKRWVREFLEACEDHDFTRDGFLDTTTPTTDSCEKWKVLEAWQEYSASAIEKKVMSDLVVYSEEGFEGTKRIDLFKDKKDTAHIRFLNGVVKVTKDETALLPYAAVKSQGAVWESTIIRHNITLGSGEGEFSRFCELAMHRHDLSVDDASDWRNEYQLNEAGKNNLRGMRTSYGYLLHAFNPSDGMKAIYYIDQDSQIGKPEGRNGKSFVMESVEKYKKTAKQNGKKWRQGLDGGARFQFSNVDHDTGFILINDIRPEFEMEELFADITDDMEVERKGRDKVVIPKDKKPKFGLTTNYVIPGNGTSFKARQHVVEFGNYWNRCTREGESPADPKHFGRLLLQGWQSDDAEWDKFYNYGFECLREYLRDGLYQPPMDNYEMKAIRATIEGASGDGSAVQWIDEWIQSDRLQGGYHKGDGIAIRDLYDAFCEGNPEIIDLWDFKRFDKALWQFCDSADYLHYNGHLAAKGNTKSSRRWRRGGVGEQRDHIRITSDRDPK